MLQQEFHKAEELVLQLKAWVDTEIALAKLKFAEKLSKVISNLITVLFVGSVLFLFIFFASFALAWLVGELFGRIWAGFLMVAIFYLIVGIVAWLAREKILRAPVMNAIIRRLFSKEESKKI
ncbi:MAG: phage holin family protein [Ferruginibacter sp.]